MHIMMLISNTRLPNAYANASRRLMPCLHFNYAMQTASPFMGPRYASSSSQADDVMSCFAHGQQPSPEAMSCIRNRQAHVQAPRPIAISTGECRHGYPQVLVQHAVDLSVGVLQSGMLRLTCPHLVREIDSYERTGAVAEFNKTVAVIPDVRDNFDSTHKAWQEIRKKSMTEEERKYVEERLGDHAEDFLSCGFIGIKDNSAIATACFVEITCAEANEYYRTHDVKCLHAHVADHLIRGNNIIGATVLRRLKDRGVDPSGCDGCSQQCDSSIPKVEAKWWYEPAKNKAKLIRRKDLRREQRQNILRKKSDGANPTEKQ